MIDSSQNPYEQFTAIYFWLQVWEGDVHFRMVFFCREIFGHLSMEGLGVSNSLGTMEKP